jgi:V8-like Glu-specific endopeptidase
MTVQLVQDDFQRLVGIVAKDDSFRSVTGRARLVAGALEGSPRADDVLLSLDLDGAPRGVAVEVIRRLSSFGRITADKESLGIFLNYLLFFKGEEDEEAAFIRGLFETYALDRPIVPGPKIGKWWGSESEGSVQEKIIGEDTLRHVRVLELALEAARAVVHVTLLGGYGTGFVVGDDLLMTNNHVLDSADRAMGSTFTFDYQLDVAGKLQDTTVVSAQADGLFHTNPDLDYTVVQLAEVPDSAKPLRLRPVRVKRDDRVAIIQHPGGHVKKISMQNNFVAYADDRVVQYTTSTMPGSSGSPVFDEEFEVVAIHHSGGMLAEPGSQRHYLRNAGSSMVAVLRDLEVAARELYERLNR